MTLENSCAPTIRMSLGWWEMAWVVNDREECEAGSAKFGQPVMKRNGWWERREGMAVSSERPGRVPSQRRRTRRRKEKKTVDEAQTHKMQSRN